MPQLDRTQPPPLPSFAPFSIEKAQSHVLAHGIPAYSISAGKQEVIRLDFIFGSGSWEEETPLAATFTNRMLQEGSKYRSGRSLAETLDAYGAYLQYESGVDRSSVSLYTLSKHLNTVLPVVLEIIFMPGFPLAELETTVRNQQQQLAVDCQKVSVMARRTFMQSVFGSNNPYGYQLTAEDLAALRPDQLARFHKKNYTTDNLTVISAGWQAEKALEQLNKVLVGLPASYAEKSNKAHAFSAALPGRIEVSKTGALQHALRLGKPLVGKLHPDYVGLKVLNTVLGGYFGSRLMSNLREDKGYTYGVGSAILSYERAAFFTIATEVGADVSEDAVEQIIKELNKLRSELIPDIELAQVRSYLQGVYLSNFDGAFALADRFKDIHFFGLDYQYYDAYIGAVQNIGSEKLLELAQTYLSPDSLFIVRAGG